MGGGGNVSVSGAVFIASGVPLELFPCLPDKKEKGRKKKKGGKQEERETGEKDNNTNK